MYTIVFARTGVKRKSAEEQDSEGDAKRPTHKVDTCPLLNAKGCWFASLTEAEAFCLTEFGITNGNWKMVDDPLPGCQHHWIAPVRVKGRAEGKPERGKFERLRDGLWIAVES